MVKYSLTFFHGEIASILSIASHIMCDHLIIIELTEGSQCQLKAIILILTSTL